MEVLRTAIWEMCRQQKNSDFCPSEVLKAMFPEDWEQFLDDIVSVVLEMNREGLIIITENGIVIDKDSFPLGSIRINCRIPNQSRR